MRVYRALQGVTFMAGSLVALASAQAATRAHALEPTDEPDVWRATAPVQFKAGEIFTCEGKLPATLAELLEADPAPATLGDSDPTPAPQVEPAPAPQAPTLDPSGVVPAAVDPQQQLDDDPVAPRSVRRR